MITSTIWKCYQSSETSCESHWLEYYHFSNVKVGLFLGVGINFSVRIKNLIPINDSTNLQVSE